ncbi:helix-turn-helix domain-containing protein [Pseudoclavibacter helvolus]|uniref:helix-turn-helix domain-containing protein n=1 Tax=Pseudoclavibacter helvolus TaxID=255205 RepID=UPI0037350BB1
MTDKQLPDATAALLSPSEAAGRLHVTTKTLQRMAERGEVRAVKLPSGHRRYSEPDIERIVASQDEAAILPAASA